VSRDVCNGTNPSSSLRPSLRPSPLSFLAGIEATCVWPMEYIKTQLQLQEKLAVGEKPKFTGMIGGEDGREGGREGGASRQARNLCFTYLPKPECIDLMI